MRLYQVSYDRTFTWDFQKTINCPGNVPQCDVAVGAAITTPDFVIPMSASGIYLTYLEATCAVTNLGPQSAAFDIGVVFGTDTPSLGPAGARPEQAHGTYRGVAFGWLSQGPASPDWSIDFLSGHVNASGAPVLSTHWLLSYGNGAMPASASSQDLHIILAVWSGAPTQFNLEVGQCSIHVTARAVQSTASIVPPATQTQSQTVTIMSVNQQNWNNWTPQTPDLGASVTVTYILGGQQHVTTQSTPFSIQIDAGTQITATAGSAQEWIFKSWNWWGDANNYPSSVTWYTPVRGFIPQGTTSYYIAALYTVVSITPAIVTPSVVVSSAMVTANGEINKGSNANLAVLILTGFLAIFVLVPLYAVMSSRRRRRSQPP